MRVILANSICKMGGVSTFLVSLRAERVRMGKVCELFFFERGPMGRISRRTARFTSAPARHE